MKNSSLIIFLLILLWAAAHPLQAATENFDTKSIQYSFTIKNTSNKVVPEVIFQTYSPVPQTSRQKVVHTDSSYKHTAVEDNLGNQVLQFTFHNLPPFSSKIIRIRSKVLFRGLTSGLSPETAGLSPDNPDKQSKTSKNYLLPEPHIESDLPEIIELANKLKQEETLATVKAIFDWVAGNVQYSGYRSKSQGALYALQNKNGDCTEYMALFVALCRAAGVPARGIGGYVIVKDSIVKPADYHNWAEFYHDGTWQLADPQEKKFMQNEKNYIAMQIIGQAPWNSMGGNSRFMVSGSNIKVKMN